MSTKKIYVALGISASNPISSNRHLKDLLTTKLNEREIKRAKKYKSETIYCLVECKGVHYWEGDIKNDKDEDTIIGVPQELKSKNPEETKFIDAYIRLLRSSKRLNFQPYCYELGEVIWLHSAVKFTRGNFRGLGDVTQLGANDLREIIKDEAVKPLQNTIRRIATFTVDRFVMECIRKQVKKFVIRSKSYAILNPAKDVKCLHYIKIVC